MDDDVPRDLRHTLHRSASSVRDSLGDYPVQSVRAAHGSPAALVMANDASDLIRAGEIGVDIHATRNERIEAAAYYPAATGQVRQFDDVFGELLDGPT